MTGVKRKMERVLFILKYAQGYGEAKEVALEKVTSTGMYHSAKFISSMLIKQKILSKVSVVFDNNSIDALVSEYKPTHVFIEGLWVVPEKFDELLPLHPGIIWHIRCHSELPFLAQEGIAVSWLLGYITRGVKIACNSSRIWKELVYLIQYNLLISNSTARKHVVLLPNHYPMPDKMPAFCFDVLQKDDTVHIGCFGAIRSLKNHLSQAWAAIDFAERRNLRLKFHINANAASSNGKNILKNLRSLFATFVKHDLVEHETLSHVKFKKLLASMHVCMQVSVSETFNFVAADAVSIGKPIVVSNEIKWATGPKADPTSTKSITKTICKVWKRKHTLCSSNFKNLSAFCDTSRKYWEAYIRGYFIPGNTISEVYYLWQRVLNWF